jgi:hypothetical protein
MRFFVACSHCGDCASHTGRRASDPHVLTVFVRACESNNYKPEECSSTYNAYLKLNEPYAGLLKSSVHNSRADHWKEVAKVVGLKLAGLGLDSKEVRRRLEPARPACVM